MRCASYNEAYARIMMKTQSATHHEKEAYARIMMKTQSATHHERERGSSVLMEARHLHAERRRLVDLHHLLHHRYKDARVGLVVDPVAKRDVD